MRAGVLYAPLDLRVEDHTDPQPREGEVIVEVAYNGLCGTDLTEYTKGPMMVPLQTAHPGSGHVGPTILGHEFIGTVVGTSASASQWMGRRVASGAGVWCGECSWCRRGRTNLCAQYYTLGLSTHGGLATFVTAPAKTLREIGSDCPDIEAALAQPLAVGLHGVARAGVQPGDHVVVLGAGAIGSFILAALAGHEGPITALDIDPDRLAVAQTLGAGRTALLDPAASREQVRDLVPEGAEVVIESSGAPGAADRAFALAARGATVLLVGLMKAPQPLVLSDLVLREIDVKTTVAHVCDSDLPRALALLADRPLSPVLVDRVVDLGDVVRDGLEPMVAGDVHGKVLVDPRNG
jgi:(R,R)-butanediol dehydrogenase/meso-butanediol dehydrogenase/diacetyl reductase